MRIVIKKTKAEIIGHIKRKANKGLLFISGGGVNYKLGRNKILLQSTDGKWVNAFQRVFVLSISEDSEGKSVLEGRFRYRNSTLIFIVFWLVPLLYVHIGTIMSMNDVFDKVIISMILSIFYMAAAGLFISGKLAYKKHEDEVIKFIEKL